MALDEFWRNVRTASQLDISVQAVMDSTRLDPAVISQAIANSDQWLSRYATQGYDESDFAFLPEADRTKLSNAVRKYREILAQKNPRGPATKEQLDAARPYFQEIVQLFEFDRFADANAYRIGKTIEQDPLFPWEELVDVRYRTKIDSMGEPAVKVMTYLPDSEEKEFLERGNRVHRAVAALVFELAKPYWPYVSCRTQSDFAFLASIGDDE